MSKVQWSAALADYLKDETKSYAFIANKYHVSKQSVVKRAVKEDWQSLRNKTLLKVDQKLTEIIGEDVAIINSRHAQIGKFMQSTALKALKNLEPRTMSEVINSIKTGVEIERKALRIDDQIIPDKNQKIMDIIEADRKKYGFRNSGNS